MKENSKNSSDDLYDEALNLNSLECKAAFMSINVPEPRGPILIFGEHFMKKFYTVFDRDEKVLGFSIANQNNFKSEKSQNDIISDIKTPYDDDRKDSFSNGAIMNNNMNFYTNRSNGNNFNSNGNGRIKINPFNFLEEKMEDKITPISKIIFKERNSMRNNINKDNMQGKDDLLFVHP